MDEQQTSNHARFGELRSLLAGELNGRKTQQIFFNRVEAQAKQDIMYFQDAWVPYIQQLLSNAEPWQVDSMDRMERLTTLLPFLALELSLAGRLTLYADVLSRRADMTVAFKTTDCIEPPLSDEWPVEILRLRQVYTQLSLAWTFNEHKNVHMEIMQQISRYRPFHGHVSFDGLEALTWHLQRYPNQWMVVDRNAREFARIDGDVGEYAFVDEEVFVIASFETSRKNAYIGVTQHIDGGMHGDEPACQTYARFDDLEAFLTCGARHAFVAEWPNLEIWPEMNNSTKTELLARSCARTLPKKEILTRLCDTGISILAAQTLWSWLQEDVVLLIESRD